MLFECRASHTKSIEMSQMFRGRRGRSLINFGGTLRGKQPVRDRGLRLQVTGSKSGCPVIYSGRESRIAARAC